MLEHREHRHRREGVRRAQRPDVVDVHGEDGDRGDVRRDGGHDVVARCTSQFLRHLRELPGTMVADDRGQRALPSVHLHHADALKHLRDQPHPRGGERRGRFAHTAHRGREADCRREEQAHDRDADERWPAEEPPHDVRRGGDEQRRRPEQVEKRSKVLKSLRVARDDGHEVGRGAAVLMTAHQQHAPEHHPHRYGAEANRRDVHHLKVGLVAPIPEQQPEEDAQHPVEAFKRLVLDADEHPANHHGCCRLRGDVDQLQRSGESDSEPHDSEQRAVRRASGALRIVVHREELVAPVLRRIVEHVRQLDVLPGVCTRHQRCDEAVRDVSLVPPAIIRRL
mmetsp:Transcript_37595/g.116128  ORF Transcript_37595/g.116128 Transcript_37595/m.116128 type:complete len:338 (-) Transcript_37595:38-1051(-)